MATNRDLIRRSYQKLGELRRGDEPSSEEVIDGMLALQSYYDSLVEEGVFGRFTDVLADEDYEAQENERVNAAGFTITLPTVIEVEGEDDRSPRHLAIIAVIRAAGTTVSVYDGYAAEWRTINGLDADDDFPLPNGLFEGVAALLAIQLSPDSDADIPAAVVTQAARAKAMLSRVADSPEPDEPGVYF